MNKIHLLFLLVETLFLLDFVNGCFLTKKHSVYVVNNLPPNSAPLKIHCASKNDDIGNHVLYANQDFYWDFCENFFPGTLFFCHFWWGSKEKAFEAYNQGKYGSTAHQYWWIAKSDGIYFSNQTQLPSLNKIYDWNT